MGSAMSTAMQTGASMTGGMMQGVAAGFGSSRRDAYKIDPATRQALRTGVRSATEGLESLPDVDTGEVIDKYREQEARLRGLSAPEPTVDPEALTEDIARTSREATRPIREESRRRATQSAGAFGPSSTQSQAFAAQEAGYENQLSAMLARLRPQLEQVRFNQQIQQLSAALGLESERTRSFREPVELVNTLRQGYIGQLMGAGAPARAVPQELGYKPWAAVLSATGKGLQQAPATYNLVKELREG